MPLSHGRLGGRVSPEQPFDAAAVNTLFVIFSVLTVVSALMVVLARNPVTGAMFMIVSFIGMAGLFVLLEAFFLAILQVLVYAGAVMVLFLFIIMLLDVDEIERFKPKTMTLFASSIAALLLVVMVAMTLVASGAIESFPSDRPEVVELPTGEEPFAFATRAKAYGYGLFTKYLLPIQMVGVLLLIAMIGIIVLSKRYEEN